MNQDDGQAPTRRVRRRRPVAARRFTGVGRHGRGDTEAVLAAWAALDAPGEPVVQRRRHAQQQPLDEFDAARDVATTVLHPGLDEDPEAPQADGASTQESFLARADQDADEVGHAPSGFADALQRLGVQLHDLPAGYLPAADLFSEREDVDVKAHRARRRRRGWISALVVVLVLAVVGAAGWYGLSRLTAPPADYDGPGSGSIAFTVEDGEGTHQIGKELASKDVVKSADAFYDEVKDAEKPPVFQPGTFQLRKKMAAKDAIVSLTAKSKKVHYFALSSNTRIDDAIEKISDGTELKKEDLQDLAHRPEEFGLPKDINTIEGYLHPGEYRVPVDATPKEVLAQLVDKTKKTLVRHGAKTQAEQYRVLKLASVVAGEGTPKDFPRIAGIIENRLKPNDETHGYLQLDSTVSYGLGQVSIHLTKKQLKDKSNRYNTYVHKGLPPGPIGSPGDKAIAGAAQPKDSDDFYWVTVNLKTGETKFSKTLKTHEKNVKQYRTWCKANQDLCR